MENPPGLVQSDLLTIKHTSDPATLFPSHAFGRGGVGHFLCTGHSRVGLQRLPQATSQPASLSVPARRRLASSRSAGSGDDGAASGTGGGSSLSGYSLISSDPVSIGATRAWEAGTVAHTHNFVAASRTVRPTDIPKASKWAAVSYFENDPRQVARHMCIMDHVQARNDETKAAERQAEQARHSMWAEQQRETFRRQRIEQAARYARSGIRPRSAYADLGAVEAAEAAHAAATAASQAANAHGHDGSLPPTEDGGMSAPPSARGGTDPTQRFYSSGHVRAVLSTPGFTGPPLYGSVGSGGGPPPPQPHHQHHHAGGRLRPATAGFGGSGSGTGGNIYGAYSSAYGSMVARSTTGSSNNLQSWHQQQQQQLHRRHPSQQDQEAGVEGGFAIGGRSIVPIGLPKKTFVHVHERMAAEAADLPAARVAAVEAAKARAEEERTQAVIAGELEELDSFEARMRTLQRVRSRQARSQHQHASSASAPEDDREADG